MPLHRTGLLQNKTHRSQRFDFECNFDIKQERVLFKGVKHREREKEKEGGFGLGKSKEREQKSVW